ncbi:methyl-accepting chemotaxis protein [Rhizobium rhizosphaerae]|nr:methyl-accepting chemotaxis protein [Xaviernesmea rhizosphaerae]
MPPPTFKPPETEMPLSNVKISTKLIATSALSMTLVIAMLVNQQISSNAILASNDVVKRELIILDGVSSADLAFARIEGAVNPLLDHGANPQQVTAALAEVKKHADIGWAALETPISIAAKPQVLSDIRTSLRSYEKTLQDAAASGQDLATVAPRLNAIDKDIHKAIDQSLLNARGFSDKAKQNLFDTISAANVTALSIGALILLIMTLSALFLARTVSRPIRRLTGLMNRLAGGDLDVAVEGADRRDEIGEMARAVQVFRDNGVKGRELEQVAQATRSQSEAERARVAEIDQQRAAEMSQATNGLGQGLQRLSEGDLAFRLTESFAPDFERLRTDFNGAVENLRRTMGSVINTAGAIDGGAQELSQAATDLAKRTEQQAAALEETAAALDQITSNVQNSSKRTEDARGMAKEANDAARKSGEVVANAVDAMQRIEVASSQISNIIGVIDEIAFQTNLLALNAGVEAARAGEAGKGFAVVAQEVRELAQRSAQAAKEIKELIRNSEQEVGNGVDLVKATGSALKVINEHVLAINGELDAIATSSREQATGLSEVNTAVNQMDQTTQQNAAMVEQATAASNALANEAERLRQMMTQFDLGQPSARPAAARPASAAKGAAPVASPARRLVQAVAGGMRASANDWQEF